MYLIPQFLQIVKDFGAFEDDAYIILYAVASGIVMQFSGRLFDKFGVRWLAVAGTSCLAVAMFVFYRIGTNTGNGMLLFAIVLLGASAGLCMMPLQTYLMKAAPQSLIGRVSSLTGSIQQVMISFAVSQDYDRSDKQVGFLCEICYVARCMVASISRCFYRHPNCCGHRRLRGTLYSQRRRNKR